MMKKQKNILRYMYWTLPCMLLLAGCESGTSQEEENAEPMELQVVPMVATTRSAIQDAELMQEVAVYATGTDYGDGNNYAVYTINSGSWGNNTATKIYLTNAAATIYAYYPTTKHDTDLNIPITLLEGTDVTTITTISNATNLTIASADGEVDCMWATAVDDVSNAANKSSVALTMKHALSMVSFRVYKDASYTATGSLTKVVVENVAGKNLLSRGSTLKMKITDGVLTSSGAAQNAKYTRAISGYTLASTSANANKLSILVLPIDGSIGTDNIKATFTVDGADYSVNLTAPSTNSGKWVAGSNHLYTVKLSGTGVSVTQVDVTQWVDVAGGNLDIK